MGAGSGRVLGISSGSAIWNRFEPTTPFGPATGFHGLHESFTLSSTGRTLQLPCKRRPANKPAARPVTAPKNAPRSPPRLTAPATVPASRPAHGNPCNNSVPRNTWRFRNDTVTRSPGRWRPGSRTRSEDGGAHPHMHVPSQPLHRGAGRIARSTQRSRSTRRTRARTVMHSGAGEGRASWRMNCRGISPIDQNNQGLEKDVAMDCTVTAGTSPTAVI